MCDFKNGFILCKCTNTKNTVHNKKSRRNKLNPSREYNWILNKYVGRSSEMEMGRYELPVNDLKDGLTADVVLHELNEKNCFDFDYTPHEGDNLVLANKPDQIRMEFIFKSGKWREDHYPPFDHVVEKVDQGKVMKS